MTLQDIIDDSLKKGTLTKEGIDDFSSELLEAVVCHHEWARLDGELVCVIVNGSNSDHWVIHNLDAKTLFIVGDKKLKFDWIDT